MKPHEHVPTVVGTGIRWLATAAVAVAVAGVGVALVGDRGPLPLPLLVVGSVATGTGLWLRARRPSGPFGEATAVLGVAVLLLAARAAVAPGLDELDAFLAIAGAALVVVGFGLDDRRPVVLGIAQWAVALGRPAPDADAFRHCLVATDVVVPLPRMLPLVALGVAVLVAGEAVRRLSWRVEAGHGLETTGLALVLGALAAKALELPGHPALCGTGDAVDAGWAALFLGVALAVGLVGTARADAVWAGAALASSTLFALAATTLERNPVWALLVGAPLVALVGWADVRGVPWPRRLPAAAAADGNPLRARSGATETPPDGGHDALRAGSEATETPPGGTK